MDKNGYLAEEISKQNVEGMAWFLLKKKELDQRAVKQKRSQELIILEILSLPR